MKLSLFASAWAFGGLSACQREVESGLFDGVEGPPPETAAQARELYRAQAALHRRDLQRRLVLTRVFGQRRAATSKISELK